MCFKAFIQVRVQRGKSEMLIAEQTLDEGSWVGHRPRDWHEVFAILIKEVSMYLSFFSYILLLLAGNVACCTDYSLNRASTVAVFFRWTGDFYLNGKAALFTGRSVKELTINK